MPSQAQIMAEYLALEKVARKLRGRLLPEDVDACVTATAFNLGIPVDDVRDAVRAVNAGMQG